MVKSSPTNACDIRDVGSIPGSGRSLAGGNGNPLVFLPMNRGDWWATVLGVTKSQI